MHICWFIKFELCFFWNTNYYASTTVYVVDCTNRDSSPHDWYTMTLHTYIQSWKFAYLFSSSEEKIKFTCQKVRCVSSNNNREEQKKFHFRQQQHIGLLITLVEFQLLHWSFHFWVCMTYAIGPNDTLFPSTKIWKGSNQLQKEK